jgi:hypothetical protein
MSSLTPDQEILIRLDRIEQMLAKIANLSPAIDNPAERLIRLARIDKGASIAAAKEMSRVDSAKRRAAKKGAQPWK